MKRRNFFISGFAGLFVFTRASFAQDTPEPPITSIVVLKQNRKIYFFNGDEILYSYPIRLGFAPEGHKIIEGDGKTPEGIYFIDLKKDDSSFHLSLRISYPNKTDKARAAALGKDAGGDIFIHGRGDKLTWKTRAKTIIDWTEGCIALKDAHIEQIYQKVALGTPIEIRP